MCPIIANTEVLRVIMRIAVLALLKSGYGLGVEHAPRMFKAQVASPAQQKERQSLREAPFPMADI